MFIKQSTIYWPWKLVASIPFCFKFRFIDWGSTYRKIIKCTHIRIRKKKFGSIINFFVFKNTFGEKKWIPVIYLMIYLILHQKVIQKIQGLYICKYNQKIVSNHCSNIHHIWNIIGRLLHFNNRLHNICL